MPFYPRPLQCCDMGDSFANFFTTFMRKPCRLVYRDPNREVYGSRPETGSLLWDRVAPRIWNLKRQYRTALTDAAPLHIITSESLSNLCDLSRGHAIAPERFRPNIMLSGCKAWEEESWKLVEVDGVGRIAITSRCPRCGVPDVKLDTGERDREVQPSTILKKFHTTDPSPEWGDRPMFGMWAIHLFQGNRIHFTYHRAFIQRKRRLANVTIPRPR